MTCCEQWKDVVNDLAYTFFNPNTTAARKIRYQNPVQGTWFNCTFAAALGSITWVHPKFDRDLGSNPPFQYSIWDESNSSVYPVQIDRRLIVKNINDNPPSFCGGKSQKSGVIVKEVWFSLYEKAYAKFCLYKKDAGKMSAGNLNDPAFWPLYNAAGAYDDWYNPCTLSPVQWGGNPVTVMVRLTGCSAETYQPPANVFNVVSNNCTANKTNTPMAAWTYPNESYLPNGYHYSANGIHNDHSYSILGIFTDENKINYIVLRDTTGVYPTNAELTGRIYAGATQWSFKNTHYVLPDGSITRPLGLITELGVTTNLTFPTGLGIFAMKASEFGNYFEGFGRLIKAQ